MLKFKSVPSDLGVSAEVRGGPSECFALDPNDNLYIIMKSGVCKIRNQDLLIQQYIQEDKTKVSDGNIHTDAFTGHASSIGWDSALTETAVSQKELSAALPPDTKLNGGGLWVLDLKIHALRLVVADALITVAGGEKGYRDGFSRLAKDTSHNKDDKDDKDGKEVKEAENDGLAAFVLPLILLRMKHAPKVVIIELLDLTYKIRVRILDMATWKVSTLATTLESMPGYPFGVPFACFKNPDCLPLAQHLPNKSSIIIFFEHRSILLNVETGDTNSRKSLHRKHSYFLDLVHPIASNMPLYNLHMRFCGLSSGIYAKDCHLLASLWIDSYHLAFLTTTNSLFLVAENNTLMVARRPFFHSYGSDKQFLPWKSRTDALNMSQFIDHDVLPGNLLLEHEASGRTWLVHEMLMRHLWNRDLALLPSVVRNSKLSVHVVDAFIRYLHHGNVFDLMQHGDQLRLALDFFYLCKEAGLGWTKFMHWFGSSFLRQIDAEELSHCLIRSWNHPSTPWVKDDPVIIILGEFICKQAFKTFSTVHASYNSDTCRDHVELRNIIKSRKHKKELLDKQHQGHRGFHGPDSENIFWRPLKLDDLGGADDTDSSESDEFNFRTMTMLDLFRLDNGKWNEVSKTIPTDMTRRAKITRYSVLFVCPSASVVTDVQIFLLYHKWNWFRRLMKVKECEEARSRIIHLPSWVTPKILAAILECLVSTLMTILSPKDACTLLEFRDELELVDVDQKPHPPFKPLIDQCVRTLERCK